MSDQATSASGSSSWPTATAQQFAAADLDRLLARQAECKAKGKSGNGFGLTLENAAMLWRTPGAAMALHGPMPPEVRAAKGQQVSLDDQASHWMTPRVAKGKYTRDGGDRNKERPTLEGQSTSWSTPRASDGEKGRPNQSFGAGGTPLPAQAAHWATPTARMYRGGGQAVIRKDGKSRLDMLDWQAEAWSQQSAQAHQMYDGWTSLTPIPFSDPPSDGSISGPLLAEISAYRRWSQRSGGAAGWRGIWTRRPRRSLNVRFAEYLMFWPAGWTRCDSAETEFTRWLSQGRSLLSTLCSPPPPAQGNLL
ncbi:MAG: hypothetical protein ABW043_16825 [Devosia sp.]|uniref:hypothetical protein n=1 Tax=Devosia sp. TaxID=1871048 RepID=UPI003397442B